MTSARLKTGSYVVVQGDQASWDWSKLAWNASSQAVVRRVDNTPIEFNYMVFGVTYSYAGVAPGVSVARRSTQRCLVIGSVRRR